MAEISRECVIIKEYLNKVEKTHGKKNKMRICSKLFSRFLQTPLILTIDGFRTTVIKKYIEFKNDYSSYDDDRIWLKNICHSLISALKNSSEIYPFLRYGILRDIREYKLTCINSEHRNYGKYRARKRSHGKYRARKRSHGHPVINE